MFELKLRYWYKFFPYWIVPWGILSLRSVQNIGDAEALLPIAILDRNSERSVRHPDTNIHGRLTFDRLPSMKRKSISESSAKKHQARTMASYVQVIIFQHIYIIIRRIHNTSRGRRRKTDLQKSFCHVWARFICERSIVLFYSLSLS